MTTQWNSPRGVFADSCQRRPEARGATTAAVHLVFLASGILLSGVLVYVVDRGGNVTFLAALGVGGAAHPLPIGMGGALPSLIHTVAFSLLTTAVMQPSARAWMHGPLVWLGFGLLLEVAQHPTTAAWLRRFPTDAAPFLLHLQRYAQHGTFSAFDLFAIVLGAVTAALLVRQVS